MFSDYSFDEIVCQIMTPRASSRSSLCRDDKCNSKITFVTEYGARNLRYHVAAASTIRAFRKGSMRSPLFRNDLNDCCYGASAAAVLLRARSGTRCLHDTESSKYRACADTLRKLGMRSASREFRFSHLIPASLFTSGPPRVGSSCAARRVGRCRNARRRS
jgi:hypothetical protein